MSLVESVSGVYSTAGEAWQGCIAEMLDLWIHSTQDPSKFTVPTGFAFGGRASIQFDYTDVGVTNRLNFLIDTMDPSETLPVFDFLQQPGAQASVGVPFDGTGNDNATYDFVRDKILHGMQGILFQLTNADIITESWNEIANPAGGYKTGVRSMLIRTPNTFHVLVDGLRGSREPRGSWGWTQCAGPTIPTLTPVIPMPTIDTSKLVDAIEAITDQDFEVGLNQNAALFSVKSKVVAS